MSAQLPINLQILQWARTSLGLSLDEVAHMMKKPANVIQDWESGNSSPSYIQLETLAYKIYKRPITVFFFPEIPIEDNPQTDFRSMPDDEIKHLPSYMVKLYRKAKVLQLQLEELYEGRKPVEINLIDRFAGQTSSNSIAEDIRGYLNIPLKEQFSWNSQELAFKNWRNAIERNGIFIFKDAFRNNSYSGFCIYHDKYPIIFINNSFPSSRQIFTLFHELWHLLIKKGGISFRNSRILEKYDEPFSGIEVECNKFAGEFLVPSKSLNINLLQVEELFIEDLAKKYAVSREVILRKYLDFGLITSKIYRSLADKWINEADKSKKSGGNYYLTQKQYLGENYINLVLSQYYQNRITLENLSDFLHIKEKKSHLSNITFLAHKKVINDSCV